MEFPIESFGDLAVFGFLVWAVVINGETIVSYMWPRWYFERGIPIYKHTFHTANDKICEKIFCDIYFNPILKDKNYLVHQQSENVIYFKKAPPFFFFKIPPIFLVRGNLQLFPKNNQISYRLYLNYWGIVSIVVFAGILVPKGCHGCIVFILVFALIFIFEFISNINLIPVLFKEQLEEK